MTPPSTMTIIECPICQGEAAITTDRRIAVCKHGCDPRIIIARILIRETPAE